MIVSIEFLTDYSGDRFAYVGNPMIGISYICNLSTYIAAIKNLSGCMND